MDTSGEADAAKAVKDAEDAKQAEEDAQGEAVKEETKTAYDTAVSSDNGLNAADENALNA